MSILKITALALLYHRRLNQRCHILKWKSDFILYRISNTKDKDTNVDKKKLCHVTNSSHGNIKRPHCLTLVLKFVLNHCQTRYDKGTLKCNEFITNLPIEGSVAPNQGRSDAGGGQGCNGCRGSASQGSN